ncbi:Interleukin [Xyrichtys novacula]|uniref:Interleukin n=1 Tax=Xyrichtys novacula TaxID=13765 RepID=A0AAV1FDX4_XYRNO|nr:Interleukin [Xyrichtys novacula]
MDCIMKELNGTVREECADPKEDIDQAIDFFQIEIEERTSKGQMMTNSSECACESWSQAPFSQFLNKVEALLQSENAAALW